jgi:hypothetical protein
MPALAAVLVLAAAAVSIVVVLQRPRGQPVAAIAERYCLDCHNTTDWDGGFAFEPQHDSNTVTVRTNRGTGSERAVLEKAARKVRAGLMPPADAPRPQPAVLKRFAAAIESRLDRSWAAHPEPGAEPLSRLNRTEYRNAVRDLLAFDASHVIETLPADEVVAGFDNIGDGLSVSPTLIEAYVAAAMTIAREVVGDRDLTPTQVRYEGPGDSGQDAHVDGLPLGTRGGFTFVHNFPLDAEYELRVGAIGRGGIATQALCPRPEVIVAIDGRTLDVEDPTGFRVTVRAGPHAVAVAVVDPVDCAGVNDLFDVYSVAGGIRHVEIHGPFDSAGPGDTPGRRAIFTCHPEVAAEQDGCAERILRRLASRAYRRPLSGDDAEITTLLGFFRRGRDDSGFEAGIRDALARILMSPQFVFQLEHEPAGLAPGEIFEIDDLELATRLSFFLWSSIPDTELMEIAGRGELRAPATLAGQVTRMLEDPRARALTDNFAAQWLSLRELREALPQDREFDASLRDALEQQTLLTFARVVNENTSVLELLDADTTYLNERLARHYGIEGVRGSHMRQVPLGEDHPRRGLLGQGSWLTATSVADRTSPVIRGEWFLTHLLGVPVPTPPPGVEADLSDEAEVAREGDTLRERLERHRANPTCAACHQIMDPIGLSLENFDLIGRWREFDNGKPITAKTVLADGTIIDGPVALRRRLLADSELFVTALTEQLLTYALGRVVDDGDMPAVRAIVRDAAVDDFRFASIVTGIVLSKPFRMRSKTADPAAQVAASFDGRLAGDE